MPSRDVRGRPEMSRAGDDVIKDDSDAVQHVTPSRPRAPHYECDDCWYSCPKSGECCYVTSGRIWWGSDLTAEHARSIGLRKVGRFHFLNGGSQQPSRTRKDGKLSVQQHAANNFSTLFVFRRQR